MLLSGFEQFWTVTHLSVDWHENKKDDICGIKPNYLTEGQIWGTANINISAFPNILPKQRQKIIILKRVMFLNVYTLTHTTYRVWVDWIKNIMSIVIYTPTGSVS